MKITEIIGKKVLDSKIKEIGKIQDIDVDILENNINEIIINSKEFSIRKDYIKISPEDISGVGDYILLKINKEDLSSKNKEEVPDVEIIDPEELEEKEK